MIDSDQIRRKNSDGNHYKWPCAGSENFSDQWLSGIAHGLYMRSATERMINADKVKKRMRARGNFQCALCHSTLTRTKPVTP